MTYQGFHMGPWLQCHSEVRRSGNTLCRLWVLNINPKGTHLFVLERFIVCLFTVLGLSHKRFTYPSYTHKQSITTSDVRKTMIQLNTHTYPTLSFSLPFFHTHTHTCIHSSVQENDMGQTTLERSRVSICSWFGMDLYVGRRVVDPLPWHRPHSRALPKPLTPWSATVPQLHWTLVL